MSIIFEFITKSIPDYDNEKHVLRKIYQVLENALRGGIMSEWIIRLRKETTALHVGLVDKWIVGFWSTESAMTYQPRATPYLLYAFFTDSRLPKSRPSLDETWHVWFHRNQTYSCELRKTGRNQPYFNAQHKAIPPLHSLQAKCV